MSSGDVTDAAAQGVGGAPPDQVEPEQVRPEQAEANAGPPDGAGPDEAPVIDAEPAHRLTATPLPQWAALPVHDVPKARGTFRAALGVDDATWARGRDWAPASSLPVPDDPYFSGHPARIASALRRLEEIVADG
ncbi:hypothetical protein ACQEU8_28195 [Streptomyces sp. CA-250714]|uniref:hypothetical protein n=1 Tax=Streptomyces sp. CA-250714 TaxID=3240060 RepID=UPI003D941A5F